MLNGAFMPNRTENEKEMKDVIERVLAILEISTPVSARPCLPTLSAQSDQQVSPTETHLPSYQENSKPTVPSTNQVEPTIPLIRSQTVFSAALDDSSTSHTVSQDEPIISTDDKRENVATSYQEDTSETAALPSANQVEPTTLNDSSSSHTVSQGKPIILHWQNVHTVCDIKRIITCEFCKPCMNPASQFFPSFKHFLSQKMKIGLPAFVFLTANV
jgi:hypothetical protein